MLLLLLLPGQRDLPRPSEFEFCRRLGCLLTILYMYDGAGSQGAQQRGLLVYVNFNFVEGPSVAHMCRASDRRRLTATYLCWSLYTAQVPRGFLCVCRLTGLFVVTTGSWSEWFLFFLLLLLLHLRGPSGSCSWWSRCAQGEQHLEAVRHVIP